MGYPATIYRTGKCKPCGVTYRWEDSEGLKLTDACCVDCGGDLTKAGGRRARSHEVKDVEAVWIRKRKKTPMIFREFPDAELDAEYPEEVPE